MFIKSIHGFYKIPRWKEEKESQDNRNVEKSTGEEKKYNKLKEFFYDFLLPLALTFGMSNKEFWEDDPELLWAYRKSYMDKVKLQQETDNFNAWLNGLYVFKAVNVSLHNGFGKGQAKSYISKPYDFSKTAEEREIEEREDSIKEQLRRGKRALSKGVDE